MPIVILVGASGSGKTTIAKAIAERFPEAVEVLFFDSIGVPSAETMVIEFGSLEGWQRAKTFEWMHRLVSLSESGRNVILEGQMRLAFLSEGASAAGLLSYIPILVDCNDATRTRRLIVDRQQPELANDDMMKWATFLRAEALGAGCDVLDTSELSLEQSISYVAERSLLSSPADERPGNVAP